MMALKCILTDGYFLSCHKADGENPVDVRVKSAKNNYHSYEPWYKVRHQELHRSRVSWQCGRQSVCRKQGHTVVLKGSSGCLLCICMRGWLLSFLEFSLTLTNPFPARHLSEDGP